MGETEQREGQYGCAAAPTSPGRVSLHDGGACEGAGAESDHVSAEELVKRALIEEYGKRTEALNLVAMTDGARGIRLFF
ncbi:hypothetical protein U27_03326 [Candidatus Vecturithrix granuli]|uniref:Uncharacterized protein n=1 Tax=Vecturithrix granuli TaxID=1499967 RepID=A0A081BVK9_VECG1|nr:hypothetical protein U27_03326 [Candidatus Vecturithrix granuli]